MRNNTINKEGQTLAQFTEAGGVFPTAWSLHMAEFLKETLQFNHKLWA